MPKNYPWLVAQNLDAKDDTGLQSFYTLHDPLSPYECRIPELLGRRIRGCFHNWVILSNHPHNVMWSLWNPVTSEFIRLPPLLIHKDGDFDDIGYCCLSSPPDDPSSVLLLMRTRKPNIVYCKVERYTTRSRWIEMSYAKQLKTVTGKDCILDFPTCSNGKVYALGLETGFIIQFDIVVKNEEVLINLMKFQMYPLPVFNGYPDFYWLKGSNTELFCIRVSFDPEAKDTLAFVSLFKLDMNNTTSTWEEIEDLKDAVFFADICHAPSSVFYNPAISSEELRGHLYIRGRLGNVIYSYNVKDKTVSLTPMIQLERRSHVSLWECRLEGDSGTAKCTFDYQQDVIYKDDEAVPRSISDGEVEGSNIPDESPLLNIPFHLLEKIMEFCVGIEYMYFRATCKRCNLAAPEIQWTNEAALRKLVSYTLDSPLFMVLEDNRGIMSFTDPRFGDKYFMKTLPVSILDYNKLISCSRYGWLLFYSSLENLVFFNPFTSEVRTLPDTPHLLNNISFSAPPTSPKCTVVGFARDGNKGLAYILRLANENPLWQIFSWYNYGRAYSPAFYFPTFYGRDLYALCNEYQLVVFKDIMSEGSFSQRGVVTKAPKYDLKFMTRYFLVKRDQHLLLVTVGGYGEFVEVFQLNNSSKEWEKINCLGQHKIYICGTTCLCIEAKNPKMENKIYFPRMDSHNGKIVFYSLETCMYHTFNGEHIEKTWGLFFETKHHLYPHLWIEPSWN